VQLRNPSNAHERALLIVRQVQPTDFAGDLVLRQIALSGNNVTGLDNRLQIFDNETTPSPPATETAHPNPFEFNAGTPAAERRLWVEGINVSAALRDTGFQLGIRYRDHAGDHLENDGDRVATTVIGLMIANNTSPFNTPISRVQIEGILNTDRTSFDLGDLTTNQATSLFRASAEIPLGITGNTIQARLSTTASDTSAIETHIITLTRSSGNRFVSRPILAIPSAIPRAEVTFATPQDVEIIRARASGRLQLQLEGVLAQLGPIRANVRGRVVELCTITIQGASPAQTVANNLRIINRIFAQCGVEFRVLRSDTVNNPAVLDMNQPSCPLTIGGDTHRNTQELTLFAIGRATCVANFIVYFVRSITGLRGCSAYPVGLPGVTIADDATQYTFSHEIGHVLRLPHITDNTNLMNTTTTPLPATPNLVRLRRSQCTLVQGSPQVVFRE
jgi:hypothetical protein